MEKKKILFWGTPDIAVPALQSLADLPDVGITGVCVPPDKPVGRKQILSPCPVKSVAQELDLPIIEIKEKSDLLRVHESETFDLALVIAFGMIFPASMLGSGKYINVHFSLLPRYRGASPVQSAILSGDRVSGITFQKMEARLDSGPILLQKEYPIEGKSTSELFHLLSHKTARLLPDFLETYVQGGLVPVVQKESEATVCKKFTKKDGAVFPHKETAETIYRKFLAFDLFPGIFLSTPKGNVKLTQITLTPDTDALLLPCKNNTHLFIQRAQIPGKKEMPIREIIKGNPAIFSGVVN
ncbi:methionyl-tRNA formyltransferase [Candidatus Gracilibacteria bacterium]|nr:methionyl-tRNA formyltransferase [Candidatus Gracilibacteria bacterium]